jgi:hypothetical protein
VLKKILFISLFVFVFLPLAGVVIYYIMNADTLDFESVCEKGNSRYTSLCENVGKHAVSQLSIINLNDKDYGVIVGVSWRKKGNTISSSNQKTKRVSEKNAYYYIIEPNKDKKAQFLRAVSETDAR